MTHKDRKQLRDILVLMQDLRALTDKTENPHLRDQLKMTEDLAMSELFGELVVADSVNTGWQSRQVDERSQMLKSLQQISQSSEFRRNA